MDRTIKKLDNHLSSFFETLYLSSAILIHKFTQDSPYNDKEILKTLRDDSNLAIKKETIEMMNENQMKVLDALDWSLHDVLYQKKFHDFCKDVYLSNSFSPMI